MCTQGGKEKISWLVKILLGQKAKSQKYSILKFINIQFTDKKYEIKSSAGHSVTRLYSQHSGHRGKLITVVHDFPGLSSKF